MEPGVLQVLFGTSTHEADNGQPYERLHMNVASCAVLACTCKEARDAYSSMKALYVKAAEARVRLTTKIPFLIGNNAPIGMLLEHSLEADIRTDEPDSILHLGFRLTLTQLANMHVRAITHGAKKCCSALRKVAATSSAWSRDIDYSITNTVLNCVIGKSRHHASIAQLEKHVECLLFIGGDCAAAVHEQYLWQVLNDMLKRWKYEQPQSEAFTPSETRALLRIDEMLPWIATDALRFLCRESCR